MVETLTPYYTDKCSPDCRFVLIFGNAHLSNCIY